MYFPLVGAIDQLSYYGVDNTDKQEGKADASVTCKYIAPVKFISSVAYYSATTLAVASISPALAWEYTS